MELGRRSFGTWENCLNDFREFSGFNCCYCCCDFVRSYCFWNCKMNKKGLAKKTLAEILIGIVSLIAILFVIVPLIDTFKEKAVGESCLTSVTIATSPKTISPSLPNFDTLNCETRGIELEDDREEIAAELRRHVRDCRSQYGNGELPLGEIPWFFLTSEERECFVCYVDRTETENFDFKYNEVAIVRGEKLGVETFFHTLDREKIHIGPESPLYVGVKVTAKNTLIVAYPSRRIKTRFFPFIYDINELKEACGNDVHIFT